MRDAEEAQRRVSLSRMLELLGVSRSGYQAWLTHAIIKREWLNRFKIKDYQQAYQLVFKYLEAFYNTVRIHSHCDYLSPDDFEKLYDNLPSMVDQYSC